VAVLSRACVTSDRREFRYEWDVATDEQSKAAAGVPFVLPLAVDDVGESEPSLDLFRDLQWERAPLHRPSRDFLDKLRMLIRTHRSAERGRT
jgi:hypothetical protein